MNTLAPSLTFLEASNITGLPVGELKRAVKIGELGSITWGGQVFVCKASLQPYMDKYGQSLKDAIAKSKKRGP